MRRCPICGWPGATEVYPQDMIDHLYWEHRLGHSAIFTFPENLTWEQVDAFYHAALLGVDPKCQEEKVRREPA
jgi:hypothetical protein